jgi:hypothetical protein
MPDPGRLDRSPARASHFDVGRVVSNEISLAHARVREALSNGRYGYTV